MDESCSIQAPSSSCIKKNETTEVVSQKSNFEGSPHNGEPPLIMRYYNLTVSPPFTSTIVLLFTASHTDLTEGL